MSGLLEEIARSLADATIGRLSEAAQGRLAALFSAKNVDPAGDVYDRIRMARYILTGSEDYRPESESVLTALEPPDEEKPYPHISGDCLVLGPEIFANADAPYDPGAVICWRGRNFVPQGSGAGIEKHPDDPGVIFPPEGTAEDESYEHAPMAGTHWRGRRGDQVGEQPG